MKKGFLIIFLMVCRTLHATVPTGPVGVNEVRFDESITYQTLDGIGADCYNYAYADRSLWDWDKTKWAFDDLKLAYVRTASWFQFWEPTNDNASDTVADWTKFWPDGWPATHDIGFATFLKSKGIEVNPGFWSLPDWLLNPSNTSQVNTNLLAEVGETVATYTKNMVNNGIPMSYIEVQNEPAINASVQYPSPQALRDAGLQVIAHLDALGLSNVKLHAPNYHAPQGTVSWGQVWFANSTLKARTAAVSYHTWGSTAFADFDGIRQFAEAQGKPVWATELGTLWATGIDPTNWATGGWETAMNYYRAIVWSHASRTYQWTLVGADPAMNGSGSTVNGFPPGAAYPGYYMLKHHANFIPPQSKLVNAQVGDTNILPEVFKRADGTISIIVLNNGSTTKTLTITSALGTSLRITEQYNTKNGSYFVAGPAVPPDANGWVQLILAPQSITSAVITPQGAGDTLSPVNPSNLRLK